MAFQVYPFVCVKDIDGNTFYRPWVPIRIINPKDKKQFIQAQALLDTGADECVFPKFTVDQTGRDFIIDATGDKDMQGVGAGKIPVRFHSFIVQILTADMQGVFWSSKEMTVNVLDHDDILPILGFNNCLGHFKITFNYATRKVIVDNKPVI
jgi:hypothetical protein